MYFLCLLIYFIRSSQSDSFKFLAKLFLPLLVKKVVEKAGENMQKQQQYAQDNSWQKSAGNDEIIYNKANAKNPRETKKVGDYVDYEEID